MRLPGKKAVITGAASGIGRATAFRFAAEGASLALADIDLDGANAVAREIEGGGGTAIGIYADVAAPADVERMMGEAEAGLGGLNVLFNNAGVVVSDDEGPVVTPLATWEKTISVNLTGVFLCCKYGIPALLRTGGGSIINSAAMVAHVGAAVPQIAYTATKGGVLALSREVAVEYARANIRVNALCPGSVRTPLAEAFFDTPEKLERRRVHMPMGRFAEVEEIANAVVFLASDESSYVTGASFMVDCGITAAYVTPE